MGRKRKHFTDEDLINANREKSMKYYLKNKEIIKEKARRRYEKNKKR